MANDQAPERVWLQRIRDGEMDGWTWCAEQIGADDVAYVRADASPLPPPGSAGEAKLIPLQWSDHSPPNDSCHYDHVVCGTPLGTFRIEWKSWKDHDSYCLFLEEDFVGSDYSLDYAKTLAEQHAVERVTDISAMMAPAFVGVDLAKGQDQTARWLVLPEEGSAGEAEMVKRMIERSYGSDWMKDPDLLRSMPHHRAQIRQVLDMLRAAFGGCGAAGEESGEGRSG